MAAEHEGPARVLLCVTGCIAAYKACEVLRDLQKAGVEVRVAMTGNAEQFVGKATFEALCRYPVADDLFSYPPTAIPHIDLAEWADLILVCPCTANVLAKLACGIADDAVTSTVLAATGPVLVTPAMNVHMWRNAATQANVATLRGRGIHVMTPTSGYLACGDVGEGKLPEHADIAAEALRLVDDVPQDLAGRSLVVTAGPTHEAIDPVRYIANRSTGKMGYALAEAAARRGARVTLVSGPTSLAAPRGVEVVPVESAAQMHDATLAAFDGADAAVCAAAVADYTPAHPANHKLKKAAEHLDAIELVETADILAELAATKGDRVVVGFAAETDDLVAHARQKLARKGCDLIVANDVSRQDSTFGADTDRVALVWPDRVEQLDTLPLAQVADEVLDRVAVLLGR